MAAFFSKQTVHFRTECFLLFKGDKSLNRSGKATAVHTACAFPVQEPFRAGKGIRERLLIRSTCGDDILQQQLGGTAGFPHHPEISVYVSALSTRRFSS